jgi:hypothetical protein
LAEKAFFLLMTAVSAGKYSIALVGQNSAHKGSPLHWSHFIAVFAVRLNVIFPKGHAITHILQPMHFSGSIFTTPVFPGLFRAPVLQTDMHAASSHWKHSIGILLPLSNLKTFTLAVAGLHSPSLPSEHANSHIPHPVHLSGDVMSSISIAHSSLYYPKYPGKKIPGCYNTKGDPLRVSFFAKRQAAESLLLPIALRFSVRSAGSKALFN